MDDIPAGPASPRPRRPALSVVIPVNNGGRDFERCLRGLRASTWTDYEVVVVDDGSTDGSAEKAEAWGARVFRNPTKMGPAAARNIGALAAEADIVFFLDADVEIHRSTIARGMARFEANPALGALFGSYDAAPAAPGVVSRFRNLLHHHVHQAGTFVDDARPARTFWTGCGMIRRDVFEAVGGFDPERYRRPAIEDIELGYRVTRAGHSILLARDVQATHLKRWTLPGVVRTDIFQRGVPWMLLMKRQRVVETDLNVDPAQRACVVATGLGLLAMPAAVASPWSLLVALIAVAFVVAANRSLYGFLLRTRGLAFAMASVPLHLVYYCCCGASVAIALGLWHLAPRRAGRVAVAAAARRLDAPESAAAPAPHPVATRHRSPTR
ncbi:glycosyltransferase family 2 protein [Tundrisphaera sp. TA3]|uniref:glycosyltransferase family 2 protein n=1 Tax=Tundrisphaera sp. TA3 TaxID=3435775 RepID=UPI003EB84BC0